jgi:hypothetical protein
MFSSPILDVTIGLVFIFLLYSLLVTSLNEGLASLFALRAKMLKRAIISGMLSDTSRDSVITFTFKRFRNFVRAFPNMVARLFTGDHETASKNIGDAFFDHPLIKSYGSSRLYPLPSYISATNFSAVLLDVLKEEYNSNPALNKTVNNADIIKIRDTLAYYSEQVRQAGQSGGGNTQTQFINAEPLRILTMHLVASNFDMDGFMHKIESWYDDTMDRVSGWYKRQVQFILFILGMLIAITFNVNTIIIAGKLSTDKDARDKVVELAVAATDHYKDDPRIRRTIRENGAWVPDTSRSNQDTIIRVYKEYQQQLAYTRKLLEGEISGVNNIIALGWGVDTLKKPFSESFTVQHAKSLFDTIKSLNSQIFFARVRQDSAPQKADRQAGAEQAARLRKRMAALISERISADYISISSLYLMPDQKIKITGQRTLHRVEIVQYIFKNTFKGTRWLGFIITALAICLGAPFWFDLLNKLVKLRAAGEKEAPADNSGPSIPGLAYGPEAAIADHDSPLQQPGEEAVG